ncbi:MAG: sensor cyclic diguanylate phosphodiesterase [Deltaproteobacteria bacterium]|nr:sensor cyclic diguanylate phosphodiesterase [Deltaproteobacteria bacterium]
MIDEKKKFQEVLNVGLEVIQTRDIDILLEKILTKARYLTNADAGSIYIKEDDTLLFRYTQNETLQKLLPPGRKLIYSKFSVPVNNQSIAGYVSNTGKVLNLQNVYDLTDGVPFSFDPSYDRLSGYRTQSVLCFPLKTNTDEVVGVLQLINATDGQGNIIPFQSEDEPFAVHFANNAAIAIERATMTRDIILRMIKMAELRDPTETGAHVNRVSSYSVELYEDWAHLKGIDRARIEQNKDVLKMSAMLHDVGKVAITDLILKKPARLDSSEFEIVKQHTYLGAQLFSHQRSDFDKAAFLVTLNHHERWDGKGYPGFIDYATGEPLPGYKGNDGHARGKKCEEIPIFGRIVAICDVFDALSSGRTYKEPWEEARVLETMANEKGKHFDPEMLDVFFSNLEVVRNIMQLYPEVKMP